MVMPQRVIVVHPIFVIYTDLKATSRKFAQELFYSEKVDLNYLP